MGLYVDMEAKNDNEPYCLPVLNLVIFKFANEKARSFFFFYECITISGIINDVLRSRLSMPT